MVLDLITVLLIAYGFYSGYKRGLIQTVFDTLSILIGLLVAMKLSSIVITFLHGIIQANPRLLFVIGFVITFFAALMIVRFIGKKLEDLFKVAHVNFVNKIAGGGLMALVFALCLSLLLMLLSQLQLLSPNIRNTSITYSLIEPLPRKASGVFGKVKPWFKEFWDKTVETMDRVKEKADAAEASEDEN